ncbi:NrfD/PsrC family molybdoenzyme membrane anchor subunit [Bacillus marinisedimentorum]|uniref:NrfD/PsrC family molybdoenzyme membrane anchor subunit n=1 Tax=Bacillus marinisedimentorum TaxID=1821260 RepID=UPI000872F32F|nr:NrfD/PsrC family molybdoenzyme membrane anchor subunit [Bacillus marinisedimentorum]
MKKKIWLYLSIALILAGIAGTVNIIMHGEHAMGTSNGIPWGILIAGYEYFVGISTGLLLVASLGYVFNQEPIKKVGKAAVMMAVFTMFSGFAVLLVELGNPLHFFYYLISPNIKSPIWWMAPLYGIYLAMLVILLFHIIRGNVQQVKMFSILTLISAVVALVNIGFLFGFLNTRAYWNGPLSPVYFVVSAFMSGVALFAVITYIQHKTSALEEEVFLAVRKIFIISIAAVALIYTGKIMTALYGAASGKYEAVHALLSGPLSFNFYFFEVVLGMIVPLALLLTAKGSAPIKLLAAGISSLIGIFFMRVDMVIAGQISELHVIYSTVKEIVYHTYSATWAEWALIAGAAGITLFLYMLRDQIEKSLKGHAR